MRDGDEQDGTMMFTNLPPRRGEPGVARRFCPPGPPEPAPGGSGLYELPERKRPAFPDGPGHRRGNSLPVTKVTSSPLVNPSRL